MEEEIVCVRWKDLAVDSLAWKRLWVKDTRPWELWWRGQVFVNSLMRPMVSHFLSAFWRLSAGQERPLDDFFCLSSSTIGSTLGERRRERRIHKDNILLKVVFQEFYVSLFFPLFLYLVLVFFESLGRQGARDHDQATLERQEITKCPWNLECFLEDLFLGSQWSIILWLYLVIC